MGSTSPVGGLNSASQSTSAGGTSGTNGSTNSGLVQGTQSMFMQLLTAQLENQSPLDPVDPDTFTTELVQFNMLDQLTQINNTLTNAFGSAASGTSAGTSDSATANTNNSLQGA